MTRPRPRPGCFLGWVLLPALLGCGSDPIFVSIRNLERPSDMDFVCMGAHGQEGDLQVSGRPMAACHPPGGPDPKVDLKNLRERRHGTFALLTNTARGELHVVDLDRSTLLDLDRVQPSWNTVPVGDLPEDVATSQDGCLAVTANRGSCDLSVVDTGRLLRRVFPGGRPSSNDGSVVTRVVPRTGAGRPLSVAPHEIVFLPQDVGVLDGSDNLCRDLFAPVDAADAGPVDSGSGVDAGADTGGQGSAPPAPPRALVSFPGCDLLALIDLGSGLIIDSVFLRKDGVVHAGSEPQCPVDCGPGAGASAQLSGDASSDATGVATDAGDTAGVVDAADMNADGAVQDAIDVPPPPPDPDLPLPLYAGALVLVPDGTRIYVGASRAPYVWSVDIDGGGLVPPADGGRVRLHEDPIGVTRLRLNVDPFRADDAGTLGAFVGNRGKFLYALARDGSVRVVDIGSRLDGTGPEAECDVNIDPRALQDTEFTQGCFPVADGRPRAPLARGPGIRIPAFTAVDVPPAIVRDIAFADLSGGSNPDTADRGLDGAFGFVLGSDGNVYVLNVSPTRRSSELEPPTDEFPLTHSFRNDNARPLDLTRGEGPARIQLAPLRDLTATPTPFPVRAPYLNADGPRLEGPPVDDHEVNVLADGNEVSTWAAFPDIVRAQAQAWSVVWEGVLPGSNRLAGRVEPGALVDHGAGFCRVGVLPGDTAMLIACQNDDDCNLHSDGRCLQNGPGEPGICLPRALANDGDIQTRCAPFLDRRLRYRIISATASTLELEPKLDEFHRPALATCVDDSDCIAAGPAGDLGYSCRTVAAGDPKRCVRSCPATPAAAAAPDAPPPCREGFVCGTGAMVDVGLPPTHVGLCLEGPPVDPGCFPAPVHYVIQVGRGFLVSGSAMPTFQTVAADVAGVCTEIADRHPLLVHRISLDAPHCTDIADGTPGADVLGLQRSTAVPFANPCLHLGTSSDDPVAPDAEHVKAVFENTQIRILLTNLEHYQGDAFSTSMRTLGGFVPTTAVLPQDILVTMGARLIGGPAETPQSPGAAGQRYYWYPYMYVIDQGRANAPNSRGQVIRLNPKSDNPREWFVRFDSNYRSPRFLIQ